MSIETLMKNIFSFANILQQADTDNITSWTNVTLTNALKWAEYCEHIFLQTCNKSYRHELDEKITMLGKYVEPQLKFDLDLQKLSYASSLLKQVMLSNHHSPSRLIEEILFQESAVPVICDDKPIDLEFQTCIYSIESSTLSQLLREFLLLDTSVPQSPPDAISVRAVNLLYSLHSLYSGSTNRLSEWNFESIHQALSHVSFLKDGWALLLHTLLVEEESEWVQDMRDLIERWLGEVAECDASSHNCGLWRVGGVLLSRVSSLYSLFRTHYTHYLLTWAESMVVQYRRDGPLPRYDWKHPSASSPDCGYDPLVSQLHQLCSYPWVATDVVTHITVHAGIKPLPNIWRDIVTLLKL